ncbi:MAG: hypothetical protein HC898_01925 [Phycisphaerales bacterium]|nr:hypothetical protein [Phycisphaerales bacterium]
MGVNPLTLDFPLYQTQVQTCHLQVGDVKLPLYPMRPNLLMSPTTSPQGVSGPVMYAGDGALANYGDRDPRGAIVVLDYESHDNWERAFSLGAKAVVFLGTKEDLSVYRKWTPLPVNLLRFYAPAQSLAQLDLRKDHAQGTLLSQVTWKPGTGRDILAMVPGTQPQFADGSINMPEMLVLSASYDSYGEVPQLSPAARGAGNVAALLQTLAYFRENPPARDLLIVFLDNQARYHQGARQLYASLMIKQRDADKISREHLEEQVYLKRMIDGLDSGVETIKDRELERSLRDFMEKQAEFIRADVNQSLLDDRTQRSRSRRLLAKELPAAERTAAESRLEQAQARISATEARVRQWDNVRRFLHDNNKAESTDPVIFEQLMEELHQAVKNRLQKRLDELHRQIEIDEQRKALLAQIKDRWISLHVAYDFADVGPVWSLAISEWRNALSGVSNTAGDTPGHYGRVLAAFREAAKSLPPDSGLATDALSDTTLASRYIPGRFVNGGMIAGTYGIYNVSLMTGFDRRLHEGHPSDTAARLNWRQMQRQAHHANLLLRQVASQPGLSLSRVFSDQSLSKYPSWSAGRASGDTVGLQVTGSLSEDRPALDSLIAVIPNAGNANTGVWDWLAQPSSLPGFDPFVLEPVDGNGRFPLLGIRKDFFNSSVGLGSTFDDWGNAHAVSTMGTVRAANINSSLRFNLFPARPGVVVYRPVSTPMPGTLRVLSAATDAAYPATRNLFGQLGNISFIYATALLPPEPIKVFQAKGPVLLNVDENHAYGRGLMIDDIQTPPALSASAAGDLWQLNEMRLQMLRSRGVTDADLEALHGRAKRTLESAGNISSIETRQGLFQQSLALSRAVYTPLRTSMDDLVYSIVFLLLLAIPFAFALERLVFAATTIYRRLAGFAGMFMATFALLYVMHPGFAIASTPIIIFLAFTILLLASLVIFIITRKFRTELKAMQGQGVGLHQLEISRLGTLLAAVNMGMSTMRRRPTRTVLTAVTVVMLTFTILCFASVSTRMGVRTITQGPINEETTSGVMVRHLNYKALPPELLTQLRGYEGKDGMVADQWWLVRASSNDDPYSIARPDDGSALWLDGMWGLNPAELKRWPALAAVLSGDNVDEKIAMLEQGGVFLPSIVQEKLGLKPGDPVLFHGQKAIFAGIIDSTAFQRLTQLDGRSALPVDLIDAAQTLTDSQLGQQATDVDEQVERDFVHLSPDQVMVASANIVRQFGGDLRLINFYTNPQTDNLEAGRLVAEMVNVPVWAKGPQGVMRLIFTKLTQVTGGLALLVPVVLGGLIIFGTLLGSISDREKEIYTFSALGLAPKHVGFLFFAEASVYAVVGGMAGQLLAQTVALVASQLAEWGLIRAPSINYSSTNSLFAIGLVMTTVLVSAIYPALRAGKSANPGLARNWKMPKPENDVINMTFPFTVSAYDITGVVSFLAEHFRAHNDAGLGSFAASDVQITREVGTGNLCLSARLALAPFDLGVTQELQLTARPSEIPGVDEVAIRVQRASGAGGDWYRANRVFVQDLRGQFLLWRTLSAQMIEQYRMETLQTLGDQQGTQKAS